MIDTQVLIAQVCDEIKALLLDKNKKYGDSAINPIRIFSKQSNKEQILVRIDDKLSRIARGAGLDAMDEDVINDLIGYLVLLKVANTDGYEPWDGTDIEPRYKSTILSYLGNNKAELNNLDKDVISLQDLYSAGDRFG